MKDLILTGGISISQKEIDYVNDALINGWDANATKYIKKFEEEFAKKVGVKFARALSGGTQALTLALATLGIGQGDEVILPELTYFACSDVVKLLGAEPVFVDIDPQTWCMDPWSFENSITGKTRAVMPVWIYGNAPDMDEIVRIAKAHDLYIVEDACPAAGSYFQNKHAGSFGEFGCFSFHAAKIITTGFGGMLVTDNEVLYNKMQHLADHGEDKSAPVRFWQTDVGYTFDLPNINCAMGLAQLERLDEFVAKKNQVFDWYVKRLGNIDGLSLNFTQTDAKTNKVMTCVVLEKDFNITRQGVIDRLKSKGIDSRPFFFPISMFPMYLEQQTPVAHRVCLNGINLPSGVQRTEEEIDYICTSLKEILCV